MDESSPCPVMVSDSVASGSGQALTLIDQFSSRVEAMVVARLDEVNAHFASKFVAAEKYVEDLERRLASFRCELGMPCG